MPERRQHEPRDPIPQIAALPYRWGDGGLEVAIVTSRDGRRWGVPKGHLEPDLGPVGTALLEAFEEAGLEGVVHPERLGRFEYAKRGRRLLVEVFAMIVTASHADWPERERRRRRWVSPEEAAARVTYEGLACCIESLDRQLPEEAA